MIKRRDLLARAGAVVAGAAAAQILPGCARARRRLRPAGAPNLLVLVADDLRRDCVGGDGRAAPRTPHLDALAADGVLFAEQFVTTAVCWSSRASILTGQYVSRHGVRGPGDSLAPPALAATYPAVLRDRGYRVGFVGKWGLGGRPPESAFDFLRPHAQGPSYWREVAGARVHDTRLCVDEALEFLDDGDGRPFCLSVSFKAPHAPFAEFEPRHAGLYGDVAPPMPSIVRGDDPLSAFLAASEGGTQERARTPAEFAELVRGYWRLIAGLDDAVGDLALELARRGLDERTVVLFTSDNGLFLGEHGLSGKWLMYDECVRVPLIVRDPSLPVAARGRRETRMTLNLDVAPTLLDFAGAAVPSSMQGASLRPLLEGRPATWRRDWYYEYRHTAKLQELPSSEGVRTERWAYARYVDVDPPFEQLFDLAADPREERNLAADPAAAATLSGLRARCRELRDASR